MSASSPFRVDGDNFYRWPPEPFEMERKYNRVSHYTKHLPGRVERWDASVILDYALERIDDVKTQLATPLVDPKVFEFDQQWWDSELISADKRDDRHQAKGAAKGKVYRRWNVENMLEWDQLRRVKARLIAQGGIELEKLSTLGTDVHNQMERLARGLQPNVPVGTKVYDFIEYGRRFFKKFNDAEILGVELPVYSDTYGFAGQFDLLMQWKGKVILVDYKTSLRGVNEKTRVQCAFYKNADFIGREDGTKIPMPKIDECWGVNVRDTHCSFVDLNVDDFQWETAKAAMVMHEWAATGKSGMGRPVRLNPDEGRHGGSVYK